MVSINLGRKLKDCYTNCYPTPCWTIAVRERSNDQSAQVLFRRVVIIGQRNTTCSVLSHDGRISMNRITLLKMQRPIWLGRFKNWGFSGKIAFVCFILKCKSEKSSRTQAVKCRTTDTIGVTDEESSRGGGTFFPWTSHMVICPPHAFAPDCK